MDAKEYEVVILPDGTIKFIYYDELKPLLSAGEEPIVKRISHVDPEMTADGLQWFASLHPVNGPKLGPFNTREEAIAAEIQWLSENVFAGTYGASLTAEHFGSHKSRARKKRLKR